MSEHIKITLIIAVTAIIIVALRIYYSPYQSCVRAYETDRYKPEGDCAEWTKGH